MNQKLTPPSPERQALVTEWARRMNSGEYHAGYWAWYGYGRNLDSTPQFVPSGRYSFEPSPHHPHYAIYKEWEAHKNSGAVDRMWYELKAEVGVCWDVYIKSTEKISWRVEYTYTIQKTDKHPDNCKPKLKLLDLAKVPVGTMTNTGEIIGKLDNWISLGIEKGNPTGMSNAAASYGLRILPATKWTAVQDGEDPPVCDGLVIEYRRTSESWKHAKGQTMHSTGTDATASAINAYRVTGIAKGWTDVPKDA